MKTKFYLNGKKATRKAVAEITGEERLQRMIEEAKTSFMVDPLEENSFWLGGQQMLTIEFC